MPPSSPEETAKSWGESPVLPDRGFCCFLFWCLSLLSMGTDDGTFSLAFQKISPSEVKHERFQLQSCKCMKIENDGEILMAT